MAVGIAQDVIELVFGPGRFGLGAIFRHVQPALDEVLVGLEMELKAVGAIAEPECLVGTGGRAREVNGAGRQVERVRMPLEHMWVAAEVPAQWVALGGGGGMQAIPADLAHMV